jgi:hypothetical protein
MIRAGEFLECNLHRQPPCLTDRTRCACNEIERFHIHLKNYGLRKSIRVEGVRGIAYSSKVPLGSTSRDRTPHRTPKNIIPRGFNILIIAKT